MLKDGLRSFLSAAPCQKRTAKKCSGADKDLDALLKGKDFFILTTNQDTQFVKLYPDK